jgi:hypothetical protein
VVLGRGGTKTHARFVLSSKIAVTVGTSGFVAAVGSVGEGGAGAHAHASVHASGGVSVHAGVNGSTGGVGEGIVVAGSAASEVVGVAAVVVVVVTVVVIVVVACVVVAVAAVTVAVVVAVVSAAVVSVVGGIVKFVGVEGTVGCGGDESTAARIGVVRIVGEVCTRSGWSCLRASSSYSFL